MFKQIVRLVLGDIMACAPSKPGQKCIVCHTSVTNQPARAG